MDELMKRFAREGKNSDMSVNAYLVNPFDNCTHEHMLRLLHDFMSTTGIDSDWYTCFRKAAFLAQDSAAFVRTRQDGLELKDSERRALKNEDPATGSKWDQPFILYAMVACCSLSAAVQGMDQTAINQAQTLPGFHAALDIGDDSTYLTPGIRLGLINSAPYLCCALVGCWLTQPLNRFFGRRGTIFVCCVVSSLTCLWQGCTNSWWHLYIARFCLGFGIGPKSATVPIYAAECAPKEIRGGVVMSWQLFTALGVVLGYLSGVVFQSVGQDWQWRLVVGSPMVLPIIVCGYVFILPESPRWLLQKARQSLQSNKPEVSNKYHDKAFRSLRQLRRSDLQAARDMFLIYHSLAAEETVRAQHNRFFELWTLRRNRNAIVASTITMFFQQFCGVNVFDYYSTLIFQTANFSMKTSQKLSLGFGVINFLFGLPAIPLIDSFGRRSLLLATFPLMALLQLVTGLSFLAHGTAAKVLVTVGMYLFCMVYSVGEGPVPFVYASESMPLYIRDIGMSFCTSVNWFFNFVLSLTFPSFFTHMKPAGTFAYYAVWCIVGWWMILLFVPETRNQTLEELDARFSVPARVHARHALRQMGWYIAFYVFREKHLRKPKLDIRYREPATKLEELPPRSWDWSNEEGNETDLRAVDD